MTPEETWKAIGRSVDEATIREGSEGWTTYIFEDYELDGEVVQAEFNFSNEILTQGEEIGLVSVFLNFSSGEYSTISIVASYQKGYNSFNL